MLVFRYMKNKTTVSKIVLKTNTQVSHQMFFISSVFVKPLLSNLCALLLKEFGVYLLADDLGTNIILDSNAKSHLFQDELHLLLLLHGAICLHLKGYKTCLSTFQMAGQFTFINI